jgi:hypothetical protein
MKYINLLLLLASVAASCVAGEIAVRALGHYDEDGNFYFLSKRLRPHRPPCTATGEKIAGLTGSDDGIRVYDELLGWSWRPGSASYGGFKSYNAAGLRAASREEVISGAPGPGVVRIALFGDSFTECSNVPFEETWGYYLEEGLKNEGIDAEVLNFGVSGYGMDQAFLRWRKKGRALAPHIVIFGFQPENMKRNVNLIRPLYVEESGIPFAKPRFVLRDEELTLVNVPCLEPRDVVATMRKLTSWPLREHEYFASNYSESIWQKSRLIACAQYVLESLYRKVARTKIERDFYSLHREPARLALAIVREFRDEVESTGARFYVLHLPGRPALEAYMREDLPYQEVLQQVEELTDLIRPEERLIKKAAPSSVRRFFRESHYTAGAHRIIAGETLRKLKKDLPRPQ